MRIVVPAPLGGIFAYFLCKQKVTRSGERNSPYSALKKFRFAVRTPLFASESDKNVPSQA